MIKTVTLTFALFFAYSVVYGQHWQVENLKRKIAVSSDDSSKVNLLADLSYRYTNIDIDSAILFAQTGISLGKNIRYQHGEASCLISLGRAYMHFGNNDLALERMMDALQILEKLKFQKEKGLAIINIALVYAYLQNAPLSLNYALRAKKIAEEINDRSLLVVCLLKLCDLYEYTNKADSGLIMANLAKRISIELKDTSSWARSLVYIGFAHYKLGDILTDIYYKQESLRLNLANGDNRSAAQNYLSIAESYAEDNKIDSALYFANKSLNLAEKHHFAFIAMSGLSTLSYLYEGQNDKKALHYYKLFKEANDSFYSIKKTIVCLIK